MSDLQRASMDMFASMDSDDAIENAALKLVLEKIFYALKQVKKGEISNDEFLKFLESEERFYNDVF